MRLPSPMRAIAMAAMMAVPAIAAEQPTALAQVSDSIGAFSAALYRSLTGTPGNLAVSPLSVHAALAMTAAGARGATLAEMAQAVHLPAQDVLHMGWQELAKRLAVVPHGRDGKPLCEWTLANAVFVQKGQTIEAPFRASCTGNYGAGLADVDFSGDLPGAAQTINAWVSQKTAKRIPEIVSTDQLSRDTRLVLVNALRLKAAWAQTFYAAGTKPEPFHRPTADDVHVPTMHQELHTGYAETDAAQLVSLPFVGGELQMILVVPKAVDGLAAIEKGLDGTGLARMGSAPATATRLIDLSLPRFHLAGGIVPLKTTLQSLGMRLAFDPRPGQADFGGIVPVRPDYWLYIGEVLHRTFIDVDENGCEAAAATAVTMKPASASRPTEPEQPVVVRADRPFLTLIRHAPTGVILFMARVADPTAKD